MLFCHVVITVCACTFVTCTLIKINQSINQSIYINSAQMYTSRWEVALHSKILLADLKNDIKRPS